MLYEYGYDPNIIVHGELEGGVWVQRRAMSTCKNGMRYLKLGGLTAWPQPGKSSQFRVRSNAKTTVLDSSTETPLSDIFYSASRNVSYTRTCPVLTWRL